MVQLKFDWWNIQNRKWRCEFWRNVQINWVSCDRSALRSLVSLSAIIKALQWSIRRKTVVGYLVQITLITRTSWANNNLLSALAKLPASSMSIKKKKGINWFQHFLHYLKNCALNPTLLCITAHQYASEEIRNKNTIWVICYQQIWCKHNSPMKKKTERKLEGVIAGALCTFPGTFNVKCSTIIAWKHSSLKLDGGVSEAKR